MSVLPIGESYCLLRTLTILSISLASFIRGAGSMETLHLLPFGSPDLAHMSAHIDFSRPVFSQEDLDRYAKKKEEKNKLRLPHIHSVRVHAWRYLCRLLPVISWLPRYDFKANMLSDLIAGITVGIMLIPQSMAYGTLAGLDAAHGLYTSFFPGILYFLFGTSRHNSLGVFAVISMMVSSVRYRFVPEELDDTLQMNSSNTTGGLLATSGSSVERASPETVIAALTFTSGILSIIFAIVKAGFLSVLISDQVSAGFTTAAGVHVLSAQIDKLLGIRVSRHSGPGKLIFLYTDVIRELKRSHLPSVLMSLAGFVLLCFIKEVLNPYCTRRFTKGIPIPGDMILIVMGTLLSHFLQLQRYGVDTVGHIPSGIPSPSLPDMSFVVPVLVDALTICIVCYCISISLAQMIGRKFRYDVDSDQEFFALGVCQLFSSFFGCIPPCAAMGRTMVLVSSGGRSQLSSLIASVVVLLVIYWIGPLLESLPETVLSVIIIVALKGIFKQFLGLCDLWKTSKTDFAIWQITFLATVLLDITYGLAAGVCFAFLCFGLRFMGKKLSVLAAIPQTNLYCDRDSYEELFVADGIIIVAWKAPLFYGNCKCFENQVVNELDRSWMPSKGEKTSTAADSKTQSNNVDSAEGNGRSLFLILDFSKVSAIDTSGIRSIGQVVQLCANYGATCYIACCADSIRHSMQTTPIGRNASAKLKTCIPIVHWLPRYDWRKYFISDLVCGLIVGVMQIPQGMAYAMLAGLHPVHGLYTSFFSNLLYCAFGTSRHISFGTFAVISIMTSSVHLNGVPLISPHLNSTSDQELSERGEVSSSLTFLVGAIQFSFGLLRLGCLAQYFSDPLISGFTCGAAVHILCSQLFTVIGIEMIHYKVPWKLFSHIRDLVTNLPYCNSATLISSVVSVFILSAMKFFDRRIVRPFCGYPFPSELLLLLISIPIFRFTPLSSRYGIKLARPVPSGIPSPKWPQFYIFAPLLSDAICIAIVSFSLSVSMAKLFAKKYQYVIDANQEWRAYGIVHLLSSLFPCQVSSASLTRSLVLAESGGHSQIASFCSSLVILSALFFCGSVFMYLPKFVLASVVIVALRGSAAQFKQLPVLWKTSKSDLAVWLVSFHATVIFDALWGLIIGVLFSLAVLNRRLQRPSCSVMVKEFTATNSAFLGLRIYTIRYGGPICFLNADGFRDFIIKACDLAELKTNSASAKYYGSSLETLLEREYSTKPDYNVVAIIDGSRIAFIDASAANVLQQTLHDLERIGVKVILASFSEEAASFLRRIGLAETVESVCMPVDSALQIASKLQL
uniref:STAS domain-containing protein n=1 Tax=Trichuris muris TaxID=70415 RepID=A0A5S6R0D7_TRIMR